jgi:hypothetical protein
MISITQEQARTRFALIPPILQDAIFSVQNAEIIASTIEKSNISDEKAEEIPVLVGWVLLGFLHPEDLIDEIVAVSGVPKEVARDVSNTLATKIFSPIRPIIDRAYKPVPESEGATTATPSPATTGPKIIQEIKAPVPTPPQVIASSIPSPKPMNPVVPANSVSPVNFPSATKPNIAPVKSAPVPQNIPSPSIPKPAPKPFVIQTESVSHPILNAPNFNIPTIAEDIMGGNKKGFGSMPTASAVIEFGGMPLPKTASAPQSSASPKVTVVRFGNEKNGAPAGSLPVTPPTPEPMRTITEITPESLKTDSSMPKPTIQPSFTPLSQIPVPSPIIPKPSFIPSPIVPKPTPAFSTFTSQSPAAPTPVPLASKPATPPEKIIQKDYSEAEK